MTLPSLAVGLQLAGQGGVQLALAAMLGGLASRLWLRGADSPWSVDARAVARRATRAGAVLGLVALAAAAWAQAAVMAEAPLLEAGPTLRTLLRDTHYGHVALAGLAAWAIAAVAAWRDPARRVGILLPALLAFAWSRAAVSHAGNQGDASIDVAVDMAHLLATSLWVGMVFVATGWPRPAAAMPDRLEAGRWVASLSRAATGALAVVLLTGLYKVWRAVPRWDLLPASDYGRVLAVKLALVAVAVLLGGWNRFKVLPPLREALGRRGRALPEGTWRARLLAVLRVEAGVLVLVTAAAALLAGTEPPN